MRTILLFFTLLFVSASVMAEDWQFLLNREGDNKPIEMDFKSVKSEGDYVFLNIRYSPESGWKSLLFGVAYHQEAIVVSCGKQSYAIASEIEVMKDGTREIKSSIPLPSLKYLKPNVGSEPYRIIEALCKTFASNAKAKIENQEQPPQKLNIKSQIIDKSPSEYNWRYVAEGSSDKQKLFINTPSITRLNDNVIMVLTKSEYPSVQKTLAGVEFSYSVIKELIDCKAQTVVMPWIDFYSYNHQLVETFYREFSELKEDKIPATSLLEFVSNTACPIGMAKEVVRENDKSQENSGLNLSTGTAWLITPTNLVTAYHVIENANSIQVLISESENVEAHVIATDPQNDIAILELKRPLKSTPLNLAAKQPRLGAKVAVLGYPLPDLLGIKIQATTGEISGLRGLGDDQRFYQISAPVQSGNSGGPLLNQEGEVVGIVSSKLNAMKIMEASGEVPQNVNFSMKYPYVKALIESAGIATKSANKKMNNLEDAIHNAKNSVYLIVVSGQPQK